MQSHYLYYFYINMYPFLYGFECVETISTKITNKHEAGRWALSFFPLSLFFSLFREIHRWNLKSVWKRLNDYLHALMDIWFRCYYVIVNYVSECEKKLSIETVYSNKFLMLSRPVDVVKILIREEISQYVFCCLRQTIRKLNFECNQ